MTWITLLFLFATKIRDFADICKNTGCDFRHPQFHKSENVSVSVISKTHEMMGLLKSLRNVNVDDQKRIHLIHANNHLFDAEVRGFQMGDLMENWYYENRVF